MGLNEEQSSAEPRESVASLEVELVGLAVHLVSLTQDLVTAKLKLEVAAKTGWIHLAKARYVSPGGPNSISKLQLPSSDSEKEVEASVKVLSKECIQEQTKVRYFHHSFDFPHNSTSDTGLKNRKVIDSKVEEIKKKKKTDPLKWFGVLTPPSLKQSQSSFVSATEIALDCANIQSEILGVQNRIKYIQRLKHKAGKDNLEEQVESLDSQFKTDLTV